MSENPRRGRQARNVTNVPKILGLKSCFRTARYFPKIDVGSPDNIPGYLSPLASSHYHTQKMLKDVSGVLYLGSNAFHLRNASPDKHSGSTDTLLMDDTVCLNYSYLQ